MSGEVALGSQPVQELSDLEIERYSRQLLLREVGERGQLRLSSASAVVVGCGGLGVPAALYLAGAGVGRLRLIDSDRVALDNLPRQVAYRTSEVGELKAEALARGLRGLNPQVEVEVVTELVEAPGAAELISGAQLVLECSDSPETKFLVNDLSLDHGIPVVIAGATRFSGQLLAVPPGAACYRCLFGAAPEGAARSCREAGILGPVTGIIGASQALEGLKLLLGLGSRGGRLLDFDGLSSTWRAITFPRDPACGAHRGS